MNKFPTIYRLKLHEDTQCSIHKIRLNLWMQAIVLNVLTHSTGVNANVLAEWRSGGTGTGGWRHGNSTPDI